ncbi:polysaccharide biosynthesis/export family protein [Natronoflexus pectinivorans]|nr:polysaccharide biosynthesis/export family protein [Natronoflexus pectinivorans]
MHRFIRPFVFLVGILAFFSSCVPLKDSIYLQGDMAVKLEDIEGQYKTEKEDYLVKPHDLLYIRVTSLDERSSAFLNNDAGFNQIANNPMSASLLGYRVGLDGSIDYPFLGKIYVAGLTLPEIARKVELAASKYIDQSGAIVKLLNDNITIMGEVRGPGRFLLNSEEISILEALALAGDVTDYANRRRVRLIRKDGDTPKMLIIDTTDERIMYSPFYYVKPGDVIYVEPHRLKQWSLSTIPLGFSMSLVSASLLIFSIFSTN